MTRRATLLVGLYPLLGGIVSLAGWVFDDARLADWFDAGLSIQPNAALCVSLSGLALVSFALERRRIAGLCGALVLLIGGSTLLEWISGRSFGIDSLLLFGREWGSVGVVSPGRMGPPGSVSWTLIGTALVSTACARRLRGMAPALAVMTAAISALSLIGYVYDVDQLYALPSYTAIALQTSTFIFAVSAGIILSHPEREPMRMLLDPGVAGLLARRALPLVLLAPVGLGFLRVRGQQAGLYDTGMGTALLVLMLIGFLAALLWSSLKAVRVRERREQEAASRLLTTLDERTQVEQALRESEARERERAALLQAVLNTSPVPIWIALDPRCERVVGNSAGDALLGAEVPPEALPLQRAAREGVVVRGEEYEVVRSDGTRVHLLMHASPLTEEGKPRGAIAVGVDITARKLAEQVIARSEQRYRSLVPVLTDVPWTTDADGRFDTMQDAWSRYTGQTWEELRGVGWAKALHPDDRENVETLWKKALDDRSLYRSSGRLWHAATREFRYFEARATPILREDGTVLEWVGTCTDVHERVQAEQALREADRRKDEFLALLAHELRNPLAAVRNAVNILQLKGPPAPELQWAREVIDRQTRQLSRLIDDLLDVSRISQGKIELRRGGVDLAEIVNGAVEMSSPLIDERGHELVVVLPPEPVYLDADRTRLTQVFSNLLNNAAKYTEAGGRIVLSAEADGSEVVVSVRDTGIGIPADMLTRVFEMFTQVDRSLEKTRGGLGVGLTLVKQLVEMHGGKVEADSEGPGKGSTFIVRLPVATQSAELDERPEGRPTPTASHRILVVDDNRDAADTLAAMLRIMGNDVRTAYDGVEAVRVAGELRPHVALLDIGLPRLNGRDAARAIRNEPWGTSMVLIAVTGLGQQENRRRSMDAGFDQHLVKPVSPRALMELVAGLATARRSPDQ